MSREAIFNSMVDGIREVRPHMALKGRCNYSMTIHDMDAILWAATQVAFHCAIPDDGTFHHRLAVDGMFGVTERMAICRLLREHIAGTPPVDRRDIPPVDPPARDAREKEEGR